MGRLGAPNREQQKEKPWKTGEKLGGKAVAEWRKKR